MKKLSAHINRFGRLLVAFSLAWLGTVHAADWSQYRGPNGSARAAEMIVFELQTDGYSEIARVKVSDAPVNAYPILSGNQLFVKDQNSIALLKFE